MHTLENDYLLYDIKKVEYLIIFRIKTFNDYNSNLEIVRNNIINLINKSIVIIDINININNDDRKSRLLFTYLNGILKYLDINLIEYKQAEDILDIFDEDNKTVNSINIKGLYNNIHPLLYDVLNNLFRIIMNIYHFLNIHL